jgi:SAM-dependent methyltransferase/uncharacterized protein YbaR (Trm112 family)
VRRTHFEALRPVCPVCRPDTQKGHPLRLAHVEKQTGAHILEGALHCSNPACLREFPIIDGIPILVSNIRQYISENIQAIQARRDLSGYIESMLGDCCGPVSAFEINRQHLSSYVWDHYADLDPSEERGDVAPGSMLRVLDQGLAMAGVAAGASGPCLDVGCSAGRGTFHLAEKTGGLALGVDLHFAKLRVAAEALRDGRIRYGRRRVGLVYETREFAVQFAGADRVDFWACDACALPFDAATFGVGSALNLLDCVASPRDLLVMLGHVLRPGGKLVMGCPYDWSPAATAVEAWVGGHSQRSPMGGAPEEALRLLLTPGGHPNAIGTLRLIAEQANQPWHVRLHARSTMTYRVHLVAAERI